jgi:hypothetical protein
MSSYPTAGRRTTLPLAAFIAIASATLVLGISGAHADRADSGHGHATVSAKATAKQAKFQDAMRKLWEDHITWTRLAIISFAHDLPDLPATQARLLRNQEDIGDAIKPFYGRAAGERLTALLREHITLAADLVLAAKAGDQAAVERHSSAWYRNANEIADFLSEANPRHWPRREMRSMMRGHLDLTLAEAVAHLERDHRADIRAYGRVHRQILVMADMLSDGIAAQFPKRFR